jgi:Zn-dependent alcohol dehydrogenase
MSINGSGEDVWSRFFGQSSFARHSVVSEASVVNVKNLLRDENELKLFAPLGCGFQTGMGAILNYSNAGPDNAVMILGLGAVGMGALMVILFPFYVGLRVMRLTTVSTDC